MTKLIGILLFITALVDAHMIMRTPIPYGRSSLNNSPLDASGSDFPCKLRPGVYDPEGAQNVLPIGEPQILSFIGSVTHGGGSCQVSLTSDLEPTKDSKWMVIKSIQGGCPSNHSGNFAANATATDDAATFQYTIPDGIAPGQYTLAWSWLNKIGNREFYMNCGPATVVSSTANPAKRQRRSIAARSAPFPDMVVANLASINSCVTREGFDYVYQDPGSDVLTAGSGPYMQLTCGTSTVANMTS